MIITNRKPYRSIVPALMLLVCTVYAQAQSFVITDQTKLAELKKNVEADPDNEEKHWAYIRARNFDSPDLIIQYEKWMQQFPKDPFIPYIIGEALNRKVNMKAKEYLFRAIAIDSNYAPAWYSLSMDAELRGDQDAHMEYLARAVAADPQNADYAFHYSYKFSTIDKEKYRKMSADFINSFPEHQRAAQALYWLAHKASDDKEKLQYFEWLHKSYPVSKYSWAASGMGDYFNLLLFTDPEKALKLATEMVEDKELKKEWTLSLENAQLVSQAKKLMGRKKGAEALDLLNKLKLRRYSSARMDLVLWKANANDIAGRTQASYDSLLLDFVKAPAPALKEQILFYGKKLGKNEKSIDNDIWKRIDALAVPATAFNLKNYFTGANTSLDELKGKVVFVTYWYPACGPCRGEFPYFENVVRKFKGQDLVYLGINIYPKQKDFVVPFVKGSGYSFVPLEDFDGRKKGNLDNEGLAPMNFLIDKEGKLVFSKFRTNGNNEDELELMINMLMQGKKG